jgi:Mak10 subunit, NatC N(alpha)-terminal acetyltransferase
LDTATFIKFPLPTQPTFAQNLAHVVLRNYILGVVKCCDFIRREFQRETVYEVPLDIFMRIDSVGGRCLDKYGRFKLAELD